MAALKFESINKRRKLSPPAEEVKESRARKRRSQPNPKRSDAEQEEVASILKTPLDDNVEIPSVKGLDSSEPAIRRSALKKILEHLESRSSSASLSPTQCLQLWRGFFVIVYMHDSRNMLSVQNVLREIASTFITVSSKDDSESTDAGATKHDEELKWLNPYHTAFWETVQREWAQIDSHRMNKYLLLIRFVMRSLFTICLQSVFKQVQTDGETKRQTSKKTTRQTKSNQGANEDVASGDGAKVKQCLETLETVGPLNPALRKIPDGLRLHIFDIWNDELFGALRDLEESHESEEAHETVSESQKSALEALFGQLRTLVKKTTIGDSGAQKHVRIRAKETVKDMDEQLKDLLFQVAE